MALATVRRVGLLLGLARRIDLEEGIARAGEQLWPRGYVDAYIHD